MNILWIVLGIVGCIVLFSAILSIASFSSERFMQIYQKFSETPIKEEFNILDFIHNLNHSHFNNSIKIKQVEKDTDNFYISKSKIVGLSKKTLSSNSIASFAIVAHEMGHALQDKEGKTLHFLGFLRRIGGLIGFLFLPILLISIVFLFLGNAYLTISISFFSISGGILALAILIKSITISIEKDASKKGLCFLNEKLSKSEVSDCKKLLNSARLVYWGDLFRLLFSWTFLTKKTIMFRK